MNAIFTKTKIPCGFLTVIKNSTGFPHYPKEEHFYEAFHKIKWYKAKKQLPLIKNPLNLKSSSDFFQLPKTGINGDLTCKSEVALLKTSEKQEYLSWLLTQT